MRQLLWCFCRVFCVLCKLLRFRNLGWPLVEEHSRWPSTKNNAKMILIFAAIHEQYHSGTKVLDKTHWFAVSITTRYVKLLVQPNRPRKETWSYEIHETLHERNGDDDLRRPNPPYCLPLRILQTARNERERANVEQRWWPKITHRAHRVPDVVREAAHRCGRRNSEYKYLGFQTLRYRMHNSAFMATMTVLSTVEIRMRCSRNTDVDLVLRGKLFQIHERETYWTMPKKQIKRLTFVLYRNEPECIALWFRRRYEEEKCETLRDTRPYGTAPLTMRNVAGDGDGHWSSYVGLCQCLASTLPPWRRFLWTLKLDCRGMQDLG